MATRLYDLLSYKVTLGARHTCPESSTMKMWKRMPLLMTVIVSTSCGTSATGPQDGIPREVVLPLGQEVIVEGTVLRLAFTRLVEDSRCPANVVCVWAGNAAVEVGIAVGTGPAQPLVLNTGVEPRSVEQNGVRVTLLEVTPYPGTGADDEPPAVRLRVEDP